MHALADANASLASIVNLGTSSGGLPLEAVKISASRNAGRKILILGAHHAREWISAEVPAFTASRLVERAADPQIAPLLQQAEIWIVPVVNPDGKEWSHNPQGYRLWRKNRVPIPPFAVGGVLYSNCLGVDPNRNYSYFWGQGAASTTDPRFELYQGSGAFSEAESTAIRNLATQVQFQSAVSYHSYGQYIFHPGLPVDGQCDAACQQRVAALADMATAMSQAMKASRGTDYPVFTDEAVGDTGDCAISGDCAEWLFHERGTLAVTIELPPANYDDDPTRIFVLDGDEIRPIFEENWLGILAMLSRTLVV